MPLSANNNFFRLGKRWWVVHRPISTHLRVPKGAPNKLWVVSQGTGLYKKSRSVQTFKSYCSLEQNPGPLYDFTIPLYDFTVYGTTGSSYRALIVRLYLVPYF